MPIQQLVMFGNFMSIIYLNSFKMLSHISFVKGNGTVIERHTFSFISSCYRLALCWVSKASLIKALNK